MKFIFLVLFTIIQAFGCALCALYAPTAHTTINFNIQDGYIKTINTKWVFSENFTKLMYESYDINYNHKLEPREIKEIKIALLDYLKPRDYLTKISYYDGDLDPIQIKVVAKETKIFVQNGRLVFSFNFNADLKIQPKRVLKIEILDKEGYFLFNISNSAPIRATPDITIKPNVNANLVFYEMSAEKSAINTVKTDEKALQDIDKIDEDKYNLITKASTNYLEKLKNLLKNTNTSIFTLLLIAFIYGVLHATGPGHGKIITTSYYASNGARGALGMAIKIGFVHVISALCIVGFSFLILDGYSNLGVNKAVNLTTKASAIAIIFIAIFMIIKKFISKPYHCCSHCGHTEKFSSWVVVLGSALIPCPGTILVLMLAFSLGSYKIGIACAVMIALGMSFVIFFMASFGKVLNSAASKFSRVKFWFEILALICMIGIGVFMFISSNKVVL